MSETDPYTPPEAQEPTASGSKVRPMRFQSSAGALSAMLSVIAGSILTDWFIVDPVWQLVLFIVTYIFALFMAYRGFRNGGKWNLSFASFAAFSQLWILFVLVFGR